MKKLTCSFLLFVAIASASFALGPVPVTLWAGAAGGSFGAGANAGMDIGLALPFLPALILEAESSGTILPTGLINITAATSRVGIVSKYSIIGDLVKFRLSAGSANITTNTSFVWGGSEVSRNNSTYYISAGPEFSIFGLGCIIKAVAMPIKEGTIGEIDADLTLSF